MPNTHYYTIRNKVTGDKTLVHAKNRSHAERGFFARRFAVELTTQHELLALIDADVKPMDLVKHQASADASTGTAPEGPGVSPTLET